MLVGVVLLGTRIDADIITGDLTRVELSRHLLALEKKEKTLNKSSKGGFVSPHSVYRPLMSSKRKTPRANEQDYQKAKKGSVKFLIVML